MGPPERPAIGTPSGDYRAKRRSTQTSCIRRSAHEPSIEPHPKDNVMNRVNRAALHGWIAGGSPFTVYAKSLRLGDFTEAETECLMEQHTKETGQQFSPAVLDSLWEQTQGQPWLVNALCDLVCFGDEEKRRNRSLAIEKDDICAAREQLILERRPHLDKLAHKLEEDRVRRVVESILNGREARHDATDLQYARDIGLVALNAPLRMANPIYAEMVPRELGYVL